MNELRIAGSLLVTGALGILLTCIFFPGTIPQNVNGFVIMIVMAIVGTFCLVKSSKRTA